MARVKRQEIIKQLEDMIADPELEEHKEELMRYLENLVPHNRAEKAMVLAKDQRASGEQRVRAAKMLADYHQQAEA